MNISAKLSRGLLSKQAKPYGESGAGLGDARVKNNNRGSVAPIQCYNEPLDPTSHNFDFESENDESKSIVLNSGSRTWLLPRLAKMLTL